MSHEALKVWRLSRMDGLIPTVNQNMGLPLLIHFCNQNGHRDQTWSIEWDCQDDRPIVSCERKYDADDHR
jgi:hypothetical protein